MGDYALAASKIKFVDPLPLNMLPEPLRRVCEPPFRNMRPVDAAATALLHDLLESLPDHTERYLAELARIEQFARDRCGFAYPSWGRVDGFTWDDADRYLGSSSVTTRGAGCSGKSSLALRVVQVCHHEQGLSEVLFAMWRNMDVETSE
jgi:hypothetical protein